MTQGKERMAELQASRKKSSLGMVIVAILLAADGLLLIITGLVAFFAGFAGAYDVSNGHATPGAMVAVLGAFLAWIFLLQGIISFLCAQGLLRWQRWAFWLTIGLEVTNLLMGAGALMLGPFAPWLIALNMGIAAVILLSLLVVIVTRIFFR
jgi:hypothetical protein